MRRTHFISVETTTIYLFFNYHIVENRLERRYFLKKGCVWATWLFCIAPKMMKKLRKKVIWTCWCPFFWLLKNYKCFFIAVPRKNYWEEGCWRGYIDWRMSFQKRRAVFQRAVSTLTRSCRPTTQCLCRVIFLRERYAVKFSFRVFHEILI